MVQYDITLNLNLRIEQVLIPNATELKLDMKITDHNIENIDIINASDQGVLISFANFDPQDAILLSRVLGQKILENAQAGVLDAIPGMNNLLICYDCLTVSHQQIVKLAIDLALGIDSDSHQDSRLWRLPVCYGDAFGLDLDDVAAQKGLTADDVINRHLANELTVAIMGFLPGLAYMKGVDDSLYVPRRSSPRQHVPALSLGIAMDQTVIYPLASPGGWNLIGRVPFRPFDPDRADPVLFRAGDRIRFHAINKAEYDDLYQAAANGEDIITCEITSKQSTGKQSTGKQSIEAK